MNLGFCGTFQTKFDLAFSVGGVRFWCLPVSLGEVSVLAIRVTVAGFDRLPGGVFRRRGGRAAEGGGLLIRYRVISPIQGSNPCLSAIDSDYFANPPRNNGLPNHKRAWCLDFVTFHDIWSEVEA